MFLSNHRRQRDSRTVASCTTILRPRLNRILAHHTGKTTEQIERDSDRDNYMSAAEAASYGLVDKVLESRRETEAAAAALAAAPKS